MSTFKFAVGLTFLFATAVHAEGPGLGQPVSANEIPFYATYVMPDGRGLPEGGGTAAEGAEIYAAQCTSCHGETGTEGPVMPPVWPNELWPKSVGKHWPYATTLFDYIRRAMPLNDPKSLSDDEVYALAAFILARNGIIDEGLAMTAKTLPTVEMPNRDNFIDVWATQGEKPW
ncbi:c-type cytochrome [Ovoidimarina sediminis]|uniref:c-type cytochrome n=1 Tax=Ovoidimarina sediminis TaxID=3079856 RepID=UPI0029114BD2|nr:cytochrome c [Rhodophyticola sp. MJ-SS7]MDU8945769.1 cytochrome c [Rhodophyticola sp. MJ-SS7]